MKKLTLNETWKYCLAMWKWIVKQQNKRRWLCGVSRLKSEWLQLNGFEQDDIECDCFFCNYDILHGNGDCKKCPGQQVDNTFECQDKEYDYFDQPVKFYRKLLELNQKRLRR